MPALNALLLLRVPYFSLVPDGAPMRYIDLARRGRFWLFVGLMLTAGASEQAMSQWASAYAQDGLGLSKTAGDLLGPLLFAATMGLSRVAFGSRASVANVRSIMTGTLVACVAAYALAAFSPFPWLGLVGSRSAGSPSACCGRAPSRSVPLRSRAAAQHCSRCSRWVATRGARSAPRWSGPRPTRSGRSRRRSRSAWCSPL
ncbi:hypothetical protein [Tessaracoccus coleopterorum]|uniref:hypothetical protein n=1 Tax=Tessaracoccus coleopterorum TaxID=2714950 RepID=UPI001E4A15AB|nr:hypothetical protein [Tessaracoccus coleopterorum]